MSNDPSRSATFTEYEVLQLVGKGGKGVVYRVRHVGMNRVLAMKMLASGSYAGPVERERFRREAQCLASLSHPNIVTIFEVGEGDGVPYLTMEYVESDLVRWLAGGARHPREVVQILARVARAVDFTHERGILHRNIKPSSILLDSQLNPRLASFGLARHLPVGSLAPALGSGQAPMTRAADVWALGVVLYEALTGRRPFEGGSASETLSRVLDKEPEALRNINPAIDPDLEAIVRKCLQKAPEQRYASAAQLAGDLERWLAEPPGVGQGGVLTRLRRWWSGRLG